MKSEEYKKLSLREFDRTTEKFDDNKLNVYTMCRRDYANVFAEAVKEPFSDLLEGFRLHCVVRKRFEQEA